jgi:hypothetical protein
MAEVQEAAPRIGLPGMYGMSMKPLPGYMRRGFGNPTVEDDVREANRPPQPPAKTPLWKKALSVATTAGMAYSMMSPLGAPVAAIANLGAGMLNSYFGGAGAGAITPSTMSQYFSTAREPAPFTYQQPSSSSDAYYQLHPRYTDFTRAR